MVFFYSSLKDLCQFFLTSPETYVFKKCKSKLTDHLCIVVLRKNKNNFICNELRSGIINKNWAKFRCNGLMTVLIIDIVSKCLLLSIEHVTIVGLFRPVLTTLYKCGTIVQPNGFDMVIENVCASGIHYFLSLEAALLYNFDTGMCEGYDENGGLCESQTYVTTTGYNKTNQQTRSVRKIPLSKQKVTNSVHKPEVCRIKSQSVKFVFQPMQRAKQCRYIGCVRN
jgi:hypothetical protein